MFNSYAQVQAVPPGQPERVRDGRIESRPVPETQIVIGQLQNLLEVARGIEVRAYGIADELFGPTPRSPDKEKGTATPAGFFSHAISLNAGIQVALDAAYKALTTALERLQA